MKATIRKRDLRRFTWYHTRWGGGWGGFWVWPRDPGSVKEA